MIFNGKCLLRFKEILFYNGYRLNCDEINSLNGSKMFHSPLRIGIINWMNNSEKVKCCCSNNNFLSESIILEKGAQLIGNPYI